MQKKKKSQSNHFVLHVTAARTNKQTLCIETDKQTLTSMFYTTYFFFLFICITIMQYNTKCIYPFFYLTTFIRTKNMHTTDLYTFVYETWRQREIEKGNGNSERRLHSTSQGTENEITKAVVCNQPSPGANSLQIYLPIPIHSKIQDEIYYFNQRGPLSCIS